MVKLLSYPKYALKTIRSKKLRFFLGVFAVAIAIAVFSVTNVVINAISASYLPRIAEETGQIDIRVLNYNITSTPPITNYEAVIQQINATEGVKGATPRYYLQGVKFQGANKNYTVTLLGIDPKKEAEIKFGNLILSPNIDHRILPANHCWVRQEIAEALGLEIEENYTLKINIFSLNLTLDATFINDGMLPSASENVVITNIQTLEPFVGGEGVATEIVAQFANRDEIYDINSPDETIRTARVIGEAVQETIGTAYQVYLPIAGALENRGTGLVFLRILFQALSMFGILVSGFLIFSLMTVSVEDKVREFAMYRTIGAKKRQIFILVLTEASIICLIGAVLGIGLGYLFGLLVNLFLEGRGLDVTITVSPIIILYSVLLGISVGILASFFPALKAVRKSIISGLNPLKAEEPDLKLVRERGPDKTLFIIGFTISLTTGLIFILVPFVLISASDTVFFTILLSLFFAFGFGIALIVVGVFQPIGENILLLFIKPLFKKVNKLVHMFLKRNRQRNAITALMFVLAFGSTMIVSTTFLVRDEGIRTNLGITTGSDITIYDIAYDINGSALMEEINADYLEITTASFRTLPIDAALSGIFTIAGDPIFFKSVNVNVFGVPSNILEPLYQDQIEFVEGEADQFTEVQKNETVIISGSLAKTLEVGKGDLLRLKLLTLNPILIKLGYTKDVFLEIVGVMGKLPGFPDIHQQERFASGSAILIGQETWNFLSKLNFQESAYRLFFSTASSEEAKTIGEELRRKYQSDTLSIVITEELLERVEQTNETRVTLVNVILVFTIIIAIFAVFASTYSNVTESYKAIGILKAIGLKNADVDKIFILESGILTLSSSLLGALFGYSLGYYLFVIDAINNEWKIPFVAPPVIALISLLIAVIAAAVGAFIATRSISRKMASELLRIA